MRVPLLWRVKEWWDSLPTYADQILEGRVLVPRERWDGFPQHADECRRSYRFNGVNPYAFSNVKCRSCGDLILRHDFERGAA